MVFLGLGIVLYVNNFDYSWGCVLTEQSAGNGGAASAGSNSAGNAGGEMSL